MSVQPTHGSLAIDLYCGLGGWAEGFLSEGYRVIGFDIERHDYGTGVYPGHLVLQDVTTLHGSQFRDATVIVASPPCQAYSYRAMPWKRAKALPPPDNTLFETCFRIQREACEAAGRYIPLIVENVRGANRWVGQAKWHFGSYYLWGDVPALMPITFVRRTQSDLAVEALKGVGGSWDRSRPSHNSDHSWKVPGQDWSRFNKTGEVSPHWRMEGVKTVAHLNRRDGHTHTHHLTNQAEHIKQPGISGPRNNGKGSAWFQDGAARFGSHSIQRRAAAAAIAKIPFPLAQHIARCFKNG